MASGILGIGVSGLLSFQKGLTTVSHNIANASNENYSRQRVELDTRIPQFTGSGFVGSGVKISTVTRMYDQFLAVNLQTNISAYHQAAEDYAMASRVDNLLADSATGLSTGLQQFFSSLHDLADDPASIQARSVLLGEARSLETRFTTLNNQFEEMERNVNAKITGFVSDINSLGTALANINQEIVLATGQGAGRHTPNDLLDRRDGLLRDLAELVNITTVPQEDGALNVFVGTGQSLVVANQSNTFSIGNGEMDPRDAQIFVNVGSINSNITDSITGGKLAGTLNFREETLYPAMNSLGRMANAFADSFNQQHREGFTLDNTLGADFFAAGSPQVFSHTGNTGGATVTANIVDTNQLQDFDYELTFDGTNYLLLSNGSSQTLGPAGPFLVDGLNINIAGAANNGDRFEIQANRNGAQQFRVLISDERQVAAAAPIRTQVNTANVGNATISDGEVLDVSDPNLLNNVSIQFTSASTYTLNGSGPFAYTSGGNIDFNGHRVVIEGIPQAGDQFVVEANINGQGDNRNAVLLTDLQHLSLMGNSSLTFSDAYNSLIGDVGTHTRELQLSEDANGVLLQQSTDRYQSKSGVNLDEEAAKMLQYQQAYTAMAQVISTADTLFQTLINAVGR